MKIESKSCEHFGHKTIENKELCKNASLVLGVEYKEQAVTKGDLSGDKTVVESVAECKQLCGSLFMPYSGVEKEAIVTNMDTHCDKDRYKIKDVMPEMCLGQGSSPSGGCNAARYSNGDWASAYCQGTMVR